MKAVCGPVIEVDGELVSVYARHPENENVAEYTKTKAFENAIKRYGLHSPNEVKAIRIGTDGVIKTYFSGEEFRYSFGREGQRIIEELTYEIVSKNRDSIKGLLSCMLKNKMSNIEEIYIDKAILLIAGMKMQQLLQMDINDLIRAVDSAQFNSRLFGGDKALYCEFKRLGVLALGEKVITVKEYRGNWEVISSADEESGKAIANRHWVVQDKTYLADNKLYKHVTEYNKRYFGQ